MQSRSQDFRKINIRVPGGVPPGIPANSSEMGQFIGRCLINRLLQHYLDLAKCAAPRTFFRRHCCVAPVASSYWEVPFKIICSYHQWHLWFCFDIFISSRQGSISGVIYQKYHKLISIYVIYIYHVWYYIIWYVKTILGPGTKTVIYGPPQNASICYGTPKTSILGLCMYCKQRHVYCTYKYVSKIQTICLKDANSTLQIHNLYVVHRDCRCRNYTRCPCLKQWLLCVAYADSVFYFLHIQNLYPLSSVRLGALPHGLFAPRK